MKSGPGFLYSPGRQCGRSINKRAEVSPEEPQVAPGRFSDSVHAKQSAARRAYAQMDVSDSAGFQSHPEGEPIVWLAVKKDAP